VRGRRILAPLTMKLRKESRSGCRNGRKAGLAPERLRALEGEYREVFCKMLKKTGLGERAKEKERREVKDPSVIASGRVCHIAYRAERSSYKKVTVEPMWNTAQKPGARKLKIGVVCSSRARTKGRKSK